MRLSSAANLRMQYS